MASLIKRVASASAEPIFFSRCFWRILLPTNIPPAIPSATANTAITNSWYTLGLLVNATLITAVPALTPVTLPFASTVNVYFFSVSLLISENSLISLSFKLSKNSFLEE